MAGVAPHLARPRHFVATSPWDSAAGGSPCGHPILQAAGALGCFPRAQHQRVRGLLLLCRGCAHPLLVETPHHGAAQPEDGAVPDPASSPFSSWVPTEPFWGRLHRFILALPADRQEVAGSSAQLLQPALALLKLSGFLLLSLTPALRHLCPFCSRASELGACAAR